MVDELHAMRDRVGHVRDERSLFRAVRAALGAEARTNAAAHVQLEAFRRQPECRAAPLQRAIVVVDLIVAGAMDVDALPHLGQRTRDVQTSDAVVARIRIEGESRYAIVAAPAIPNRFDRIEAERVIDGRPAADALAAAHRHGAIDRCSTAILGVQHAHVPLALIERFRSVPAAFFDDDDFLLRLLRERRRQHAAGSTGADDEDVASEARHDPVTVRGTSAPAYPMLGQVASIDQVVIITSERNES